MEQLPNSSKMFGQRVNSVVQVSNQDEKVWNTKNYFAVPQLKPNQANRQSKSSLGLPEARYDQSRTQVRSSQNIRRKQGLQGKKNADLSLEERIGAKRAGLDTVNQNTQDLSHHLQGALAKNGNHTTSSNRLQRIHQNKDSSFSKTGSRMNLDSTKDVDLSTVSDKKRTFLSNLNQKFANEPKLLTDNSYTQITNYLNNHGIQEYQDKYLTNNSAQHNIDHSNPSPSVIVNINTTNINNNYAHQPQISSLRPRKSMQNSSSTDHIRQQNYSIWDEQYGHGKKAYQDSNSNNIHRLNTNNSSSAITNVPISVDLNRSNSYVYKTKSRAQRAQELQASLVYGGEMSKARNRSHAKLNDSDKSRQDFSKQLRSGSQSSGMGVTDQATQLQRRIYLSKNVQNYIKPQSTSQISVGKMLSNKFNNKTQAQNQLESKIVDHEREKEIADLLESLAPESFPISAGGASPNERTSATFDSNPPQKKPAGALMSILGSLPQKPKQDKDGQTQETEKTDPNLKTESSQGAAPALAINFKDLMAQGIKKTVQQEDSKLIRKFYDSLSDTIGKMKSFDETLKLKLHLNLEMIQQDQKCWEEYLKKKKLVPGQGGAADASHKDGNLPLQESIKNIHKILKAQQQALNETTKGASLGMFNLKKKPQVQKLETVESLRQDSTKHNENLIKMMDSLRSIMQNESITWSVFNGQANEASLNGKELHQKLLQNKVISLTSLYMAWILNDAMNKSEGIIQGQEEVIRERLAKEKKKADLTYSALEYKVELLSQHHEKESNRLNKKIEDLQKENERLSDVILDKEIEMRDLLNGGESFQRIKDMIGDLDRNMETVQEQCESNQEGSKAIIGFMEYLQGIPTGERKKTVKRRKPKDKASDSPAKDTQEDEKQSYSIDSAVYQSGQKFHMNQQMRGGTQERASSLKMSQERFRKNQQYASGRNNGVTEESEMSGTKQDMLQSVFEQGAEEKREDYLKRICSQFMNAQEMEKLPKLDATAPSFLDVDYNTARKEAKACQTTLSLMKEPNSGYATMIQTGKLRKTLSESQKTIKDLEQQLRDQKSHCAPVASPAAVQQLTPMKSALTNNSMIDTSSTLAAVKTNIVINLPDAAIVRLVEVSMEEMVLLEVNNPQRLKDQNLMDNFLDYFDGFLLTQYGLPALANCYFEHVMKRIQVNATDSNPWSYAKFLSNILVQKPKISPDQEFREDQPIPWSPVTQRVAIYAKILFTDAQNTAYKYQRVGQQSQSMMFSPRKRSLHSEVKHDLEGDGGTVSMFDLQELMGKNSPMNRITLKLIDTLKPARFLMMDEAELEIENLKFAQMKITAKLARFNFDEATFLEHLDVDHNDQVKLHTLFSSLADKFQVYFSIHEQIAIRNALFPNSRGESVGDSRSRMVHLSGYADRQFQQMPNDGVNPAIYHDDFFNKLSKPRAKKPSYVNNPNQITVLRALVLNQDNYFAQLPNYMMKKTDFIQFVVQRWQEYIEYMSTHIDISFIEYDQYFKRAALNFEQFANLMHNEIGMEFQGFLDIYGIGSNLETSELTPEISKLIFMQFFHEIVQKLEVDEELRKQGMIGVDALKQLILFRNWEIIPFYKYIFNKYSSSRLLKVPKQYLKGLTNPSRAQKKEKNLQIDMPTEEGRNTQISGATQASHEQSVQGPSELANVQPNEIKIINENEK